MSYQKVQEALYEINKVDHYYWCTATAVRILIDDNVDTACATFQGTRYVVKLGRQLVEQLSPKGLAGVIIHELQHILHTHVLQTIINGHGLTHLDNIAMDMAINQFNPLIDIAEKELGIRIARHTYADLPAGLSWEEYKKLLQEQQQQQGGEGNGTQASASAGNGDGGASGSNTSGDILDDHDSWAGQQQGDGDGEDGEDAQDTEGNGDASNDGSVDADVARAATRNLYKNVVQRYELNSRSRPAGTEHVLIEKAMAAIANDGTVDWRTVLQHYFQDASHYNLDWNDIREHVFVDGITPSLDVMECEFEVAVYFDASGSISNDELETFYNELRGIKKAFPVHIKLYQFDVQVVELGYVDADAEVPSIERKLAGGTDVRCVLENAQLEGHENVIVFTDGYFSPIPDEQRNAFNWFWVYTQHHQKQNGQGVVIEP